MDRNYAIKIKETGKYAGGSPERIRGQMPEG